MTAAHRIAKAALDMDTDLNGQTITAELSFDGGDTWQDCGSIEHGTEAVGLAALTRIKLATSTPGTSPALRSVDEIFYTASAAAQLEGGNTIIIPDMDDRLTPFVIRESELIGAGSQVVRRVSAAHLFYELGDGPIRAYDLTNATPATAISAALVGTRWTAGDVDDELIALTKNFDTDYLNSLEFLRLIEKEFDAILKFRVEIDGTGITGYFADLITPDEIFSGKRFEFGRDLERIEIKVDHSQVKTALFGHALGEEIDPLTGDPLPLTFEGIEWSRAGGDPADKPLGQDWVGNEEARKLYGIYDPATGERLHRYGKYESKAESAGELLDATWLIGERYHFRPLVNIEGDVADLERVEIVGVENVEGPEIVFERDSPAAHPETGAEIPPNTPIFLPFAENRQGLLIEEGVTNLLTANQSSFETSSVVQAAMGYAHERSSEWSKHGQYSQKIIRDANSAADAYMWYRCPIAGQGFAAGTPFTAQAVLYLPSGCWYVGKNITFRVRFAGGAQATGALTIKTFTLHEGENLLWGMDTLDYADRQWIEYFIWEVGAGHRAPEGTVFYTDCHMGHRGVHLLPWAPGGSPRASSRAHTSLPNPLPPEFGIGLAAKMFWGKGSTDKRTRVALELHDGNNIAISVYWYALSECWMAHLVYKGVLEHAALPSVNFSAGDVIGFYLECKSGKVRLAGRFAGGDAVYSDWVAAGEEMPKIKHVSVGSNMDGGYFVNGIVSDLVVHTMASEIDSSRYLLRGGGL